MHKALDLTFSTAFYFVFISTTALIHKTIHMFPSQTFIFLFQIIMFSLKVSHYIVISLFLHLTANINTSLWINIKIVFVCFPQTSIETNEHCVSEFDTLCKEAFVFNDLVFFDCIVIEWVCRICKLENFFFASTVRHNSNLLMNIQ